MGNTEAETPAKSDKASPQLQANVHPYSEWAHMPAYYGAGVGIPPPYFSSAVVSGHAAHPYMWSPQPMIPPFGTPYPPIYPHGSGFSHPSAPLCSSVQGEGNTSTNETMTAAQQNTEIPSKSPSNGKEHGLMKKLKGFDGFAMSPNNDDVEDAGGSANKHSQSGEGGTDGSTDGTNSQGNDKQQKRICSDEASDDGKNGKDVMQCKNNDMNDTKISLGVALTQSNVMGKVIAAAPLNMTSGKHFNITPTVKSKAITGPITVPNAAPVPGRDVLLLEHRIQDERELKRERRKQSNRESARRSRLRKQAETEELALKVENLASENTALKAELSRLTEMSEKLRRENSVLMEKLENPFGGDSKGGTSCKSETEEAPAAVHLENLLSRVNNSSSSDRSEKQQDTPRESSGAKLHQLLEPSSRTDTVAVG